MLGCNDSSELLADGFALKADAAGEDVKTGRVVPPELELGRRLSADAVVVYLADEIHGFATAHGRVFTLDEGGNPIGFALFIRRHAVGSERGCAHVVRAEQRFKVPAPVHISLDIDRFDNEAIVLDGASVD